VLLHPLDTLWHLSYVAIGDTIETCFNGGRLAVTFVTPLLAVGVCARALDELRDRPLHTAIPRWLHIGAGTASLAGAVAIAIGIGIVGLCASEPVWPPSSSWQSPSTAATTPRCSVTDSPTTSPS
jgi:hypothetical protein